MYGILYEEKQSLALGHREYLDLLTSDGLFSIFEIGFSESSVDRRLLELLSSRGIPLSFHIPYHETAFPYAPSLLKTDPGSTEKATRQFITYARALSPESDPTIVIHLSGDAHSDTDLRYIDFLLNHLEQTGFAARIAMENLVGSPTSYRTEDLKVLIDRFQTEKLGLCLDIPNLALSGEDAPAVRPIHMHTHGFTDSQRHLGLDEQALALTASYLQQFPKTPCILELLDQADYLNILKHSIDLIKKNAI